MDIVKNENPDICKQCGGQCCMNMGCHLHPDDIVKRFGAITRETLIQALKCGDYSADFWDGDVREDNDIEVPYEELKSDCWYLRARHIGSKAIDRSCGGVCANLTKHGCKFSWDDRPSGGKALIPQENHDCGKSSFDRVAGVISWIPYSDMICEIVHSTEFDDEWTDGVDFFITLHKLHMQDKTIMDLIPD